MLEICSKFDWNIVSNIQLPSRRLLLTPQRSKMFSILASVHSQWKEYHFIESSFFELTLIQKHSTEKLGRKSFENGIKWEAVVHFFEHLLVWSGFYELLDNLQNKKQPRYNITTSWLSIQEKPACIGLRTCEQKFAILTSKNIRTCWTKKEQADCYPVVTAKLCDFEISNLYWTRNYIIQLWITIACSRAKQQLFFW